MPPTLVNLRSLSDAPSIPCEWAILEIAPNAAMVIRETLSTYSPIFTIAPNPPEAARENQFHLTAQCQRATSLTDTAGIHRRRALRHNLSTGRGENHCMPRLSHMRNRIRCQVRKRCGKIQMDPLPTIRLALPEAGRITHADRSPGGIAICAQGGGARARRGIEPSCPRQGIRKRGQPGSSHSGVPPGRPLATQ
jgi:hypothetical protein